MGLSDATEQTYGKDIKHRNPAQVNWGPKELKGKPCRFVVEDRTFSGEDGDELTVSGVVNVLPPTGIRQAQKQAQSATEAQIEEDLDAIPF